MKRILLVAGSAALSVLLIFLLGNEKSGKVDLRVQGDSFIEGLRIVNRQNGVRSWTLTAKRADMSHDGAEADLSGVEVKIENRGITVRADQGRYDMEKKRIRVSGTITASDSAYAITTADVEIDGAAGTLRTDETVRLSGSKIRLEGKGMEIDNTTQRVRILKDVKATFHQ